MSKTNEKKIITLYSKIPPKESRTSTFPAPKKDATGVLLHPLHSITFQVKLPFIGKANIQGGGVFSVNEILQRSKNSYMC